MANNSTIYVGVALACFALFIAYIWFESREDDGEGQKVFSPHKMGLTLKNVFGMCLPDSLLSYIAHLLISCGTVGTSCLDNIRADEAIREVKRRARLAASESTKHSSKKKKKKKTKTREETQFEALSSDEDIELGEESNHSSNHSSGSNDRDKNLTHGLTTSTAEYPSHRLQSPHRGKVTTEARVSNSGMDVIMNTEPPLTLPPVHHPPPALPQQPYPSPLTTKNNDLDDILRRKLHDQEEEEDDDDDEEEEEEEELNVSLSSGLTSSSGRMRLNLSLGRGNTSLLSLDQLVAKELIEAHIAFEDDFAQHNSGKGDSQTSSY
jgi:hypothetical protein